MVRPCARLCLFVQPSQTDRCRCRRRILSRQVWTRRARMRQVGRSSPADSEPSTGRASCRHRKRSIRELTTRTSVVDVASWGILATWSLNACLTAETPTPLRESRRRPLLRNPARRHRPPIVQPTPPVVIAHVSAPEKCRIGDREVANPHDGRSIALDHVPVVAVRPA